MRTGTLVSAPSTDEGTFGKLTLDSEHSWVTGELPWRLNAADISCVPRGHTYTAKVSWSPKHGMALYHLVDVPDRTVVEIHAANLMGDVKLGWVAQLLGCIALGLKVDVFPAGTSFALDVPPLGKAQRGVVGSRIALEQFMGELHGEDLALTIQGAVATV